MVILFLVSFSLAYPYLVADEPQEESLNGIIASLLGDRKNINSVEMEIKFKYLTTTPKAPNLSFKSHYFFNNGKIRNDFYWENGQLAGKRLIKTFNGQGPQLLFNGSDQWGHTSYLSKVEIPGPKGQNPIADYRIAGLNLGSFLEISQLNIDSAIIKESIISPRVVKSIDEKGNQELIATWSTPKGGKGKGIFSPSLKNSPVYFELTESNFGFKSKITYPKNPLNGVIFPEKIESKLESGKKDEISEEIIFNVISINDRISDDLFKIEGLGLYDGAPVRDLVKNQNYQLHKNKLLGSEEYEKMLKAGFPSPPSIPLEIKNNGKYWQLFFWGGSILALLGAILIMVLWKKKGLPS